MKIDGMNTSNSFSDSRNPPKRTAFGGLLAGLCFFGAAVAAHAQFQPPPPEDYDHQGWVGITGGGVIVDGSKATFQQRHQIPARAYGGLDSFFWESYPTRDLIMQLEVRSIFDEHNQDIKLSLEHAEGAFVRGGLRQFRTWYDGGGGYFSPTDGWFDLHEDRMHIDSGELWIEVGVSEPDKPEVVLAYAHRYRRGLKDSTIWGRTGLTDGAGRRAILPSFREIDESRHIVEGRMKHNVRDTDFGAGLRYEVADVDNTLNTRELETTGFGAADNRQVRHREGVESDVLSTHAWTTTQINDATRFSTGYIYSRLDNDISGSRIRIDPDESAADQPAPHFTDLVGVTQVRQHVANMNLSLLLLEDLYLIPSLRAEIRDSDSLSMFDDGDQQRVTSHNDTLTFSERLELRYNGLQRWHLFTRGDWTQGQGDSRERSTVADDREVDFDRRSQRYTLGANWYFHQNYTLGFQYYHEIRKNDFDHIIRGRTGQDIDRQDFTTDAFNVRLTSRPVNRVTLVSRYDLRLSRIDNKVSRPEDLSSIRSGEQTRHIFSQSGTWTPLERLYLQGSVNYAVDRHETPAQQAGDTVLESKNDYLFTSLGMGYAYSPKTDIDLHYTYYLADNFEDNSEDSVAYGVGEYEHTAGTRITRRMADNFVWYGGYRFFYYREDTTGGNRDYDAHQIYSGLAFNF